MLLRRGWLGPRQLLAFLGHGALYAARHGRHAWKKNKAYLTGLHCGEVESLVGDWVQRSAEHWWFAPCVERLRRHQAAGDTVALMTGTPRFLADALARQLGATRVVATLCSSAAGRFLAEPLLLHPFGAGKLELLKALCAELGVPATDVFAYADSRHDLPLLCFAGHPVAVRPDAGLRAAATAAGWEVLGRR